MKKFCISLLSDLLPVELNKDNYVGKGVSSQRCECTLFNCEVTHGTKWETQLHFCDSSLDSYHF